MKNRTLEKARNKALQIMAELEGEGMFTLVELKVLLEREIANRGRAHPPALEEMEK